MAHTAQIIDSVCPSLICSPPFKLLSPDAQRVPPRCWNSRTMDIESPGVQIEKKLQKPGAGQGLPEENNTKSVICYNCYITMLSKPEGGRPLVEGKGKLARDR